MAKKMKDSDAEEELIGIKDVKKKKSNGALPMFKELISLQTSKGYWKPESRELLQRFFAQPLPQGISDIILCTLAALCVLESLFQDKQDEWTLLAQKAKDFLKSEKVDFESEVDNLADLLN